MLPLLYIVKGWLELHVLYSFCTKTYWKALLTFFLAAQKPYQYPDHSTKYSGPGPSHIEFLRNHRPGANSNDALLASTLIGSLTGRTRTSSPLTMACCWTRPERANMLQRWQA